MWIEVFRSGTHTDNKGNQNSYNGESLAQIAANYNEKIKQSPNLKLPLLKEHNQDGANLGLINQLTLNNDILMADIDITDEDTLTKIKENKIQNVSLALNGLEISHIGLLENELPALENLKPIQETIDKDEIKTEKIQNDITKLQNDFSKISNNLSPVSIELANNIINNLKDLPKESYLSIGYDLLKFIDDLNKSYLTREYSHYKNDVLYKHEFQSNTPIDDRHLLHLEILNQQRRNPELSYEQALLKIIQ